MESTNIILTAKQHVELKKEPIPDLPDDGLLVKTRLSLISTGTECICYRGEHEEGSHWAGWVKHPFYLGYSNVGEVVEVGSAVEGYAVGDRLFATAQHREYHIVKPPAVKIPDSVSDESAGWSKLATIAQTGVRRAELTMGAKVAIIGSGPIGQLLTQYCRVMGAEEIMVIDFIEDRLKIAEAHGATQTFVGSAADAGDFVQDHTFGQLADVVFDATGHFSVLPLALKLVRRFGTLLLIGDCPTPAKQVLTPDVITRQITIRGTHNENLSPDGAADWSAQRQIELLYKYISRGQMKVDDLITHRHSPLEAPDVYSGLLEDRSDSIGVIFDWTRI